MKTLVIGADGQLGTDVCKAFEDTDLCRAGVGGGEFCLDVTDEQAVHALIAGELRPDVVVNTAAFHNVPLCEEEPEKAYAVNAMGARYLAMACHEAGARLIHISTDYVFGNGGTRPYTESDREAPLSTYGASKLAGEHLIAAECENHCIVRGSGLYGAAPCKAKGGKNFVQLMLHLAHERGEVKVVADERVSPTYTVALAKQLRLIAEKAEPGLYHATSNGECSWYEFAAAIFEETGTEVKLEKASQGDFPSPVKRPDFSILENARLKEQGLDVMPQWRDALREYLAASPPAA
ncbi:MAG: dTDP-4-dehydrorhamnose reductase [Deltaproteobacteria bacterium]|nr:dTDP-4-dehydrorhamnose reductase [Deltaproteobacteria bacterium]